MKRFSSLTLASLLGLLWPLVNCAGPSGNEGMDGGLVDGPGPGADGGTHTPDAGSGTPDGGSGGGPDSGPATGAGPTPPAILPVVTVTGSDCTISTPTTWTASVYVVKCSLQVNATLTINQGTIVKLDQNASMTVGAQGTIQALGGWLYPIIFTSLKDDASGGDTNGDGTATSPAAGDWLGIEVGNGNFGVQVRTSNFQECRIYYAGQSDRSALAAVLNPTFAVFAAVNVTYSIIAHNQTHTDSLSAPPALDLRNSVGGVVKGNVFYDNFVPLALSTNVAIDDSNAFDNAAAAPSIPQPNKYNGIITKGAPFGSTSTVVWSATRVPFVLKTLLIVANAPPPRLGEGVILKFLPGGAYRLGSGTVTSVVFTSIADDAHGGDTNADGAATSPAPGDWSGVLVGKDAKVDDCQVYYTGTAPPMGTQGGVYLPAALQIDSQVATSVTVTNSVFAHNRPTHPAATASPAVVISTSGATITGNVFYDNEAPLAIGGGSSLDDSNVFDNSAANPSSPQPNDVNGVFVQGDLVIGLATPPVSTSISWSATKVPFVLGDMSITGTGLLTLRDDVILKFTAGAGLVIAQGGTLAIGNGDIFTSFRDDSHGGDTNGDGNVTMPSATDWKGIIEFGACATFMTEFFATCG